MAKWGYIRFHIKGESKDISGAFDILREADENAWEKESEISENEWVVKGNLKEPADLEAAVKRYPALMIKGTVVDSYNSRLMQFYSKNGSGGVIFGEEYSSLGKDSPMIDDYRWWNEDRIVYEENADGTLSILRFNGGEEAFCIPGTADGKTVTGIKRNAFYKNSGLRYLTIPSCVKKIGAAFSLCSELTVICEKGSAAEKYCTKKNIPFIYDSEQNINSMKTLLFSYKRVSGGIEITGCKIEQKELIVPDSIDSISVCGVRGFGGHTEIRTAVLPESAREIGGDAFSGCTSLKSIKIPEGIKRIGAGAFSLCKSLEEINIPEGIERIERAAFSGCVGLKRVILPESVTFIDGEAFSDCTSLAEVHILSEKLHAEPDAFDNTPFLEGLISKVNGFAVIKDTLYKYSGKDENITLPENVTEIGAKAFWGCAELKSVIIPEGVTKIGALSFDGCRSLSEISIPKTVSEIGNYAFNGCRSLSELRMSEGVTAIGSYAFCGCEKLKAADIPEGVREIGEGAFSGCSSLETVPLPESLIHLGADVFEDCTALSSLNIPKNVGEVSLYDFLSCENLKNLYISYGVKIKLDEFIHYFFQTGEAPFKLDIEHYFTPVAGFGKLEPEIKLIFCIYFLTSADMYTETDRAMYIAYIRRNKRKIFEAILETEVITALSGLLSLDILSISDIDSLIDLAGESGGTEMTALVMEHKNKRFTKAEISRESERRLKREFGTDPFSAGEMKKKWQWEVLPDNTLSLKNYKGEETEIFIPSKIGKRLISSLGDDVFRAGRDKITNAEARRNIVSVTISEGLSEIGKNAFSGCISLESAIIPDSVKKIGEKAFFRCSSLKEIGLPENLSEIGDSFFYRCESLSVINIPNSVTRIGKSAFYECTALKTAAVPESAVRIDDFAFAECASLEEIALCEGIEEIGLDSFKGCKRLREITLPDSVRVIDDFAFADCVSLERINIPAQLEAIGVNAFEGCKNLILPDIPKGVKLLDSIAM